MSSSEDGLSENMSVRNLQNCPNLSWDAYEDLFGAKFLPDDDEVVLMQKQQLPLHLETEWVRTVHKNKVCFETSTICGWFFAHRS